MIPITPESKEDRRWKMIFVSDDRVIKMLFSSIKRKAENPRFMEFPIHEGLPPDHEVLAVHYAWERRAFCFQIWSATFDEVPQGETLPEIQVNWYIGEFGPLDLPQDSLV